METVIANDGARLPLAALATSFTYNGDGSVNTISVVYSGVTYVQTFTYTSGLVTHISGWIAQ